ncbi:hypothetical protein E4U42_005164 [Claviceps africana]|uniref:Uncharacterized protein n=1 Tax=Claviceps africana TaxID=83212 RepID=A0A8K0J3Y2_9HYPO|nr:hypothetical protein E4U42_005164 [Claviceps africana]
MFTTKPAQALRNLFAGYHEPPGLSTQQSQKLLDGLKKSFRQQLELEYGRGSDRAAALVTRSQTDLQVRQSAATQHLKSILSNPLFSYNKQVGPMATTGLPFTERDPMDVFDHAAAKGMMNLKAATGCIMAKRQILQDRRHGNSPTPLGSSQTALRVLRWLRSTGAEADLSFLDHQAFLRALTPFLIAEGLEDSAWDWVSRTVTDTNAPWDGALRIKRAAFLLAQMVHTKSQPQYGDLDAAITTILRAEQLYHDHALLPRILVLPWRSVSWLSTVESYGHATPSDKMFDAHIAMADFLPQTLEVETAHLHLRHPTCPDDMPAMRLFNDKDKVHRLMQAFSPDRLKKLANARCMRILPWVGFLGHDTVERLWQTGRKREADWVTELLRAELAPLSHESLSPT